MPADGPVAAQQTMALPSKKSDAALYANTVRSTINKLRATNNTLKEELLLENKFSITPPSSYNAARISKLQDEADMFTRKIELERRKVSILELKVKDAEERLRKARGRMGGINAAKEQDIALSKQIKILESRLEQANVKFNEAITHNKALREQINNLRRERLVFDGIYKKLEKELHEKKKEMAKVIEAANTANEARERAIGAMQIMKHKADKEQAEFEVEWKKLTTIIEEDRKAREEEWQREMEERTRKTMELLKSKEQSLANKKKAVRGVWNIAKNQAATHVSMDKVQQFGEAFAKIQQATGISDIEELVDTFVCAEDQNFTLFNFMNELNEEIEKLEDQTQVIREEIASYKGMDVQADNLRKKTLKDMEEKLQKTEGSAVQYEKRYESAMRTVTELKTGIWNVFQKFGCNTPQVRELLGDEGVMESNLMQYLGIIEQRAQEILKLYAADFVCRNQEATFLTSSPAPAGAGGHATTQILVQPPSTNDEDLDDSDQEGDDEKPLFREHLQPRVNKAMARKGSSAFKVARRA